MDKIIISEDHVKEILNNILEEQTSKVNRYEFSRVQFKIEELQNSLNETIKELRKLQDSVPSGLKTVCGGRIGSIGAHLFEAQKVMTQLKDKIRKHKKSTLSQQVDEKKK